MVELILHIGMGKTGTSSIQHALQRDFENLSRQRAEYIGMWFDVIDPKFSGFSGQNLFLSADETEMDRCAEKLLYTLEEKSAATGNEKFILSNEGLYGEVARFSPFVEKMRRICHVKVVVYARNPLDWLPSAYSQWMIYHKTNVGPILSFAESSQSLLKTYSGLLLWARQHGDIFSLRSFSKGIDVVQDFAAFLGLQINNPQQRTLERVEITESVMRAFYNGRFDEPTLPSKFDHAIGNLDLSKAPQLDRLLASSFSYTEVVEVVSQNIGLFDEIHKSLGIDLLKDESPLPSSPSLAAVRERALEQLMLLVLDQADRITALEARLQGLADNASGSGS